MYKEVLDKKQTKLLPFIKIFSHNFGLVGGTALALQIGHRHSLDFDLFSNQEFKNEYIRQTITQAKHKIQHVYVDSTEEFSVLVGGVKFTFLYYPFQLKFIQDFQGFIKLPDLLTLASMKAYTLGRRAKWKDYVDLYFVLTKYHSMHELIKKTRQIFGCEFNEKIFRTQLAYFKDIDYTEKISYLRDFQVSDALVKKELINFALQK